MFFVHTFYNCCNKVVKPNQQIDILESAEFLQPPISIKTLKVALPYLLSMCTFRSWHDEGVKHFEKLSKA